MEETPCSPYVEFRGGGWYARDSRVSLASVIHAFRRGETPETIFQNFPNLGTLGKVYGVITFVLEHPQFVETYLGEQERLWEELQQQHPLPAEMRERFDRAREELNRKTA